MVNFGLVGYGLWGRHHAAAMQGAGGVRLAAIACASAATAQRARAEHPGIPVTIGHRDLLALPGIDALDIVVPNHLHAAVAIDALQAGKNVLLEKPMGLSTEECDRMIGAAQRSGKTMSIVHQFRLSTQWKAVKDSIDAGEIGDPLYANISLFRFPYRPGSGSWRLDRDKVGSWTLEEPVHFIDSVMWLFERYGDPQSVRATGHSLASAPGLHENFSALMRWRDGAYATITQSLSGFENHQVVEVAGTQGSIRAWWSGAADRTRHAAFETRIKRRGREQPELIEHGPCGEVFELAQTFRRVDAAFAQRRPLVSPEEARKPVIVCIEAERSAAQDRPVALHF